MEINIKPTPHINCTNIINTDNINMNISEKPTLCDDLSSMCTSMMNSLKPTNNQTAQDYPFKPGYIFKGTIGVKGSGKTTKTNCFITTCVKKKKKKIIDVTCKDNKGNEYHFHPRSLKLDKKKPTKEEINSFKEQQEQLQKQDKQEKQLLPSSIKPTVISNNFNTLNTEDKIKTLINLNIKNIWLVGPAGCGKSTITRMIANKLDIPYYCISCGIGTSATEFVGYKYPERQSTKFAEFYAQKSIILIDEMTALDPSVAQILNSALANDEIETTTGLVKRHPECIIIATSNTFGNGADRQYVANNQLDSSTIDRFVGGIIEVDYSKEYESQYDSEVVDYVNQLRKIIKTNHIRRVCSTRMIQTAHKLKQAGFSDWKELCIINWSNAEKSLLQNNTESNTLSLAI